MAQLKDIVFDSRDPASLARFWAKALDAYDVRPYSDAEVERLRSLGFTPESDPSVAVDGPGPTLFFQLSDQPKTTRNRIHLDVVTADRVAEVERLCELGASLRDEHQGYCVLLDPEGNEFCVLGTKS